jgi:putative nucleotidyltransferase with HDIG domain
MPVCGYIEQITKTIKNLPPFPEAARRVLELAEDPDVQMKDIIEVIKYDQAVTSNCLKLCNSTYFGLREKIYTIDAAVAMLGLQNIIKIVLINCKELNIYRGSSHKYDLQPGELWRHSVACAIISQLLFKEINRREDGVLFTAALLHDIGKAILGKHAAENPKSLMGLVREEGICLVEAEKQLFGIDHAELGGMIAEKWKFPRTLINSIGNHHKPMAGKILPNVEAWVRLSNIVYYVSVMKGISSHHDTIGCNVKREILIQFNLKPDNVEKVVAALPAELKKAYDILKLH